MSAINSTIDLAKLEADSKPEGLWRPGLPKIFAVAGFGIVALSFFLSLFTNGLDQFIRSYLVSYLFFMAITLGAIFFVVLQHLTHSGWSVVIRRIAENLASNIYLMAILFIPIILGMGQLYHWSIPEYVASDPLIQHKTPYLNVPFFIIRCVFYFVVWIACVRFFVSRSIQQDETGDYKLTMQMERRAAPFMLILFFTTTFFTFDTIMSLDAHWFSTIFGVYYISECAICIFACLAFIACALQSFGRLNESVTEEHYHDVGKFLFGFTVFWTYIAFSQYMLYWYANMPETTHWYSVRQEGNWVYITLLLLFGHFIFPFFGLISRSIKRRKYLLSFWAVWQLMMVWVDMYWLVMPNFSAGNFVLSIFDLTCFLGIGLLYKAMTMYSFQQHSLLALKDPRLKESLALQNF